MPEEELTILGKLPTTVQDSSDNSAMPKRKKVIVFAESRLEDRYKYELGERNMPTEVQKRAIEYDTANSKFRNIDKELWEYDVQAKKLAQAYVKGWYSPEEYTLLSDSKKAKEEYDQIDKYNEEFNRNGALDRLIAARDENEKARTAFYDKEINPIIQKRDPTFIREANNVKSFYARTDPNVDVEVVPFYGEPDLFKDKVDTLEQDDDIVIFGHSGSKLGGVPNEDLASFIKDSKADNCYLGSCYFQDEVPKFAETGKSIHYRKGTQWLGFNPQAEDFTQGMWSRNIEKKADERGAYTFDPVISNATEGKEYSIMKPLLPGEN